MNIRQVIEDVIDDEDVQPGYPTWAGQQKGLKTEPGVTWCNRALHRMLTALGGDTRPILEPLGIGYTNANAMVTNAIKNLEQVEYDDAQRLANEGQLIIACAFNMKGSGHVALVCPYDGEVNSRGDVLVGQAGKENGIMPLLKGFGMTLTSQVLFFKVPFLKAETGG